MATTPLVRVTPAGIEAMSLSEAQTEIQQRMQDAFGLDLSLAPQTPQGQIAGLLAVAATEFSQALIDTANGLSLNHATGTQLDSLGSLIGVRRLPSTRTRLTVSVTGVPGTVIPSGSLCATAGGAQFRTTASVTLGEAGASVEVESVQAGAVEVAAGALSTVVSVIPGWETVTNAAAARIIGLDQESDTAYRSSIASQTTGIAIGSRQALVSALASARCTRIRIYENLTTGWRLVPAASPQHATLGVVGNGILVVVEGGDDENIRRAVQLNQSMGVATTAAVRGGPHGDLAALQAITNGSVTLFGTPITGLNLSATGSIAAMGGALDAFLPAAKVQYIDGRFVVCFPWHSGQLGPGMGAFGSSAAETALGLDPDNAAFVDGPFVRARARPLTVTLAVTRYPQFPSDGLTLLRAAVTDVVNAYDIGEQVWSNDLLTAAESIPGTRVTSISVQHDSTNASGAAVPADGVWTLPAANLTVNLTPG